jgi:hypothetical protein
MRSNYLAAGFGEFEALDISINIETDLSHNFHLLFTIEILFENFVNFNDTVCAASLSWFEIFSSAPRRMRFDFEESPSAISSEQDLIIFATRMEELNFLGVDVAISDRRIDCQFSEFDVEIAEFVQFGMSVGRQVVCEVRKSSFVAADGR